MLEKFLLIALLFGNIGTKFRLKNLKLVWE